MTETIPTRSGIDRAKLLRIYRTMFTIRAFEERARELYQSGRLPRHAHLYDGQEAVAAGALAALNDDDYIATTHRPHGHTIARTGDLKRVMAELNGKAPGFAHGKAGSMHLAAYESAMLGSYPIVGASIPIGVGGGLAAKVLGNGRVSAAFFGDGASNQGAFHEGINLAAVWDLPVIFICENNHYAIFTRIEKTVRVQNIADRAASYGIPGILVDGLDPMAVYEAVAEAAERARAGKGPTLIEAKNYRWGGHNTADPGTVYRSREEVDGWKRRDPISRFRSYLIENAVLSGEEVSRIESDVKKSLEEAEAFAFAAPDPEPEEAFRDLFAPAYEPTVTKPTGEVRDLTPLQSLNEALKEEMERDPRLIIMGYDLGLRGGPFGVTRGLVDLFGPDRVIDTPISENGFVGAAVGAALSGVPVIAEVAWIDFTTVAMDPLVNAAAKAHYTSCGTQRVPLVLRTQEGAGGMAGTNHSQSLEAWFAHVPGLKVVVPSTPYDCKGLLKTAIRDPNPVIFIENKMLYRTKGPVPAGEYAIPLGKAEVKRAGRDVTVVALGAMVPKALAAAEKLAAEGIEIEVVDPRTLVPLDAETIVNSVQKTGRLVVFQEANPCCGFGAEVARIAARDAFDYLEAPIEVLGTTMPIPFSGVLEKAILPNEEDLIRAVRGALGRV